MPRRMVARTRVAACPAEAQGRWREQVVAAGSREFASGYRLISDVASDESLLDVMLADALADAQRFKKRYR